MFYMCWMSSRAYSAWNVEVRSAFPVPRVCSLHVGKTNLSELSFTWTLVPRSEYPRCRLRRDRVGYLWVINTCHTDTQPGVFLSVKPQQPFLWFILLLYSSPETLVVLHCSSSLACSCKAGWDTHHGSVTVKLNAVRGYSNYSDNWNSGRLFYLSCSFWLYQFPSFLSPSF